MPTDLSSITAGANYLAQQPTPAAGLAQFAGTQNALQNNQTVQLQNAQMLRNQQSQIAINNAVKANINPQTGQQDTAGTALAIANDPNITVGAQDAINSMYDAKIKGLNASGQQLDQMNKTMNIYADKLQGVMATAAKENRQVNQNDIAGVGADLINAGVMTPQQATQMISGMPTDAQGMHNWMLRNSIDTQNEAAAIGRITGNPTTIQTGAGTQGGTADAYTGALTPAGGAVANQLSPQDLAKPVSINDPVTGQPKTMTMGAFLASQGANPTPANGGAPFRPGLQVAQPAGGGAAPAPMGNGSYPQQPSPFGGAGTAVGAPASPPAPPAGVPTQGPAPSPAGPSPFGGAVATGPAPISFGAAQTGAAAGTAQYTQDLHAAANYQQNINAGEHVLSLVSKLDGTPLGMGALPLNTLRTAVTSWLGTDLPGASGSTDKAAYISELNKYLTQQATQQPGAGQSADALTQALAGTPNIHMGMGAIADTTRTLLGLQKMKQAQVMSYAQSPQGQADPNGTGYQSYAAKFATQANPVAYVFDKLSVAQRKAALAKDPTLAAQVNQADQMGLLGQGP